MGGGNLVDDDIARAAEILKCISSVTDDHSTDTIPRAAFDQQEDAVEDELPNLMDMPELTPMPEEPTRRPEAEMQPPLHPELQQSVPVHTESVESEPPLDSMHRLSKVPAHLDVVPSLDLGSKAGDIGGLVDKLKSRVFEELLKQQQDREEQRAADERISEAAGTALPGTQLIDKVLLKGYSEDVGIRIISDVRDGRCWISEVIPYSQAEMADFRQGDRIVRAEHQFNPTAAEFTDLLLAPGLFPVKIQICRALPDVRATAPAPVAEMHPAEEHYPMSSWDPPAEAGQYSFPVRESRADRDPKSEWSKRFRTPSPVQRSPPRTGGEVEIPPESRFAVPAESRFAVPAESRFAVPAESRFGGTITPWWSRPEKIEEKRAEEKRAIEESSKLPRLQRKKVSDAATVSGCRCTEPCFGRGDSEKYAPLCRTIHVGFGRNPINTEEALQWVETSSGGAVEASAICSTTTAKGERWFAFYQMDSRQAADRLLGFSHSIVAGRRVECFWARTKVGEKNTQPRVLKWSARLRGTATTGTGAQTHNPG